MTTHRKLRCLPLVVVVTFVLPSILPAGVVAREIDEQVCDVAADYALGAEDYAETIRLHRELVRKNPRDALAHYHLGFAEGMIGNRSQEIREYARADALGLRLWDLFLNLGLAQLEENDLEAATASLRRAVLLGSEHSEAHFTLALAEEKRGMLSAAERETLTALRLAPRQQDALNLLGVIYAEEGKSARAYETWQELARDFPGYAPARVNLAILSTPK
jgi:Flp pilus assembly protein TadD